MTQLNSFACTTPVFDSIIVVMIEAHVLPVDGPDFEHAQDGGDAVRPMAFRCRAVMPRG